MQLSWQIAGYGPMLGQAAHFNRYSAEKVPYGVWRYTAESRRLNDVLNKQLVSSPLPPHPLMTGTRYVSIRYPV